MLSSSVQAAVNTNTCTAYKYKHLFLTDLEAKKSKIIVLADSVSGVGPLSDTHLFPIASHGARRARDLSGVSLVRALIPFMRAKPS